ncbi:hypothetical protein [Streptomyces sp. NPDC096132]|uniref:hypothetical protein n=1 Tax=Streptomyces sp. NPDC096132 TaxID=3366075 RepID=UPI003811C49F
MRRTKRKLRTAVIAVASAALMAATVALAPGAGAVTPMRATAQYDCGTLGWTTAEFTAAQNGTEATITVTLTSITAPVTIPPYTITTTLVLYDTSSGEPTTFTGTLSNPPLLAGDPLNTGPLEGTVEPGDSLDTIGGVHALRFVMFGITSYCQAVTPLSPGPLVF